jgi:hypothetical protein
MIIMNKTDYEDYLKQVLNEHVSVPPETFTRNKVYWRITHTSHGNMNLVMRFSRDYNGKWRNVGEYNMGNTNKSYQHRRSFHNFYNIMRTPSAGIKQLSSIVWYTKLRQYASIEDARDIIAAIKTRMADHKKPGIKHGSVITTPPREQDLMLDYYFWKKKHGE